MSYDAGSIEARLTLDRTPFRAELDAAKAEARAFERDPIKLRIELQRYQAEAELAAFRRKLDEATRDREVRIRVNQNDEQAIRRVNDRINNLGNSTERMASRSNIQFNLLRTAIELLGPALVPLAGGLLGLSTAAIGFGVTGVAAFKGVQDQIKRGTDLGAQYNGQLVRIKTTLSGIGETGAKSVLSGFNETVDNLEAKLPGVNSLIEQSGHLLGDTAAHGVDALVGGLHTFTPLIIEAEGYLDRFAQKFDAWANGPGGAKFAAELQRELPIVVHFLGDLAGAATHVVAALEPIGEAGIGGLGVLFKLIEGMPIGLLRAGLTAYIAWRTAVAVTAPFNAAALALDRFATAEARAAAAGGAGAATGLRGTLSGVFATAGRIAGPIAAAVFGLNQAAHATDSWRTSTNGLKAALGQSLDIFAHPLSFIGRDEQAQKIISQIKTIQQQFSTNPYQTITTGAPTTPRGAPQTAQVLNFNTTVEAARRARDDLQKEFDNTNRMIAAETTRRNAAIAHFDTIPVSNQASRDRESDAIVRMGDRLAKLNETRQQEIMDINTTKRAQDVYNATLDDYFRKTAARNTAGLGVAYKATAGGGLDTTSKALADYQNQLQKNIDAEAKWTDTSKGATVTVGNLKVSVDAAAAAMAQSNGNVAKAEAILQGHKAALDLDKQAQAEAAAEQGRIDSAMGAAQTRYQLTTAQVNLYASALGISAEALGKGTVTSADFVRAVGEVQAALANGNTTLNAWVAAVQQFSSSAPTAASRADLIKAALISFNGPAIQYGNDMVAAAQANQKLVTDLANVGKGVINLKTGFIDYHNAGAAPVLADLAQLQGAAAQAAASTYQLEVSHKGAKQAAKDAADVFHNDTTVALEEEFQKLGKTKAEADKLANRYFKWPKDAKTQIEMLGAASTNTILDAIGRQLSFLTGHPWTADFIANTDGAITRLNILHQKILENSGTFVVSGSGAHGTAVGGIYEKYAGGGIENHWPTIAMPGANRVRVWAEPETRGEAYIPLADDWRRPRAKDVASETVHRLGGVAFFEAGGFSGVDYGGTSGGSSGSGGSGGTGSKTSLTQSDVTALKRLLANLRQEYGGVDTMKDIVRLGNKSINDIQSVTSKMLDTLRTAAQEKALPSALIQQFRADNAELNTELRFRERLQTHLDNLNTRLKNQQQQLISDQANLTQYRQQIASSFLDTSVFTAQPQTNTTSSTDIWGNTTSSTTTTPLDFEASIKTQLATAQRFLQDIKQAGAEGLSNSIIQQFEQAGPGSIDALEQVLSSGDVTNINATYQQLLDTSNTIGQQAAKDNLDLQKQIAADNAAIRKTQAAIAADTETMKKTQRDIDADIRELAKIMRPLAGQIAAEIQADVRKLAGAGK